MLVCILDADNQTYYKMLIKFVDVEKLEPIALLDVFFMRENSNILEGRIYNNC